MQIGLVDKIMRAFWEEYDEVIQSSPQSQNFMGGDFNGHIGTKPDRYDVIAWRF